MLAKKWYTSKTLWFNVLALIVAVAANYGYTGELPAEWGLFVPVIILVVNFILRLVTKQALRL